MPDTNPLYTADQLRQEMRRVREDIREDVQDVVEGAQDLTDWKTYVRSHPWPCIAVAVAAGYLLVPSKTYIHSPDASELKKLAASNKLVVKQSPVAQPSNSMFGALISLGMTTVGRAALNYLGEQAGKMLTPDVSSNSNSERTGSHDQSHA